MSSTLLPRLTTSFIIRTALRLGMVFLVSHSSTLSLLLSHLLPHTYYWLCLGYGHFLFPQLCNTTLWLPLHCSSDPFCSVHCYRNLTCLVPFALDMLSLLIKVRLLSLNIWLTHFSLCPSKSCSSDHQCGGCLIITFLVNSCCVLFITCSLYHGSYPLSLFYSWL